MLLPYTWCVFTSLIQQTGPSSPVSYTQWQRKGPVLQRERRAGSDSHGEAFAGLHQQVLMKNKCRQAFIRKKITAQTKMNLLSYLKFVVCDGLFKSHCWTPNRLNHTHPSWKFKIMIEFAPVSLFHFLSKNKHVKWNGNSKLMCVREPMVGCLSLWPCNEVSTCPECHLTFAARPRDPEEQAGIENG